MMKLKNIKLGNATWYIIRNKRTSLNVMVLECYKDHIGFPSNFGNLEFWLSGKIDDLILAGRVVG